ncbi:MAG: cytochrome b/b6 domain-containing protein [Magnetococcales bacterium]|nr:cytochrome b/b6 domain-containing protein [Magnetococcales bacterium]
MIFSGVSVSVAGEVPVESGHPHVLADNRACWECHDGNRIIVPSLEESTALSPSTPPLTAIIPDLYARSVHGRMLCIDCHRRILRIKPPHQEDEPEKVGCARCHAELARRPQPGATTPGSPRMAEMMRTIEHYSRSVHACANQDDHEQVNATCHECHDSHFFNMPSDKNSPAYADTRLVIPQLCGKCHDEQLESYTTSVHGMELLTKGNPKAAVCTDCHPAHRSTGAYLGAFKLQSADTCGSCHPHSLSTYRGTYHGKVMRLGDHYTAKCFDCHESHKTLAVKDPRSTLHPDNRLKTCQKCHDGRRRPLATAGFVSFAPHAHTMDYDRYPQMWIASRFMSGLFWSVLLFFWLHSALWYYRERRERPPSGPPVSLAHPLVSKVRGRHVRRFSLLWRVAHLLFALAVMTLLLTGMTLLQSGAVWAPVLVKLLGGVQQVGLIHRLAALLLTTLFVAHLAYLLRHLLRNRSFPWFGPDSLLPAWKDVTDCRDMFRWFLGQGSKPRFDRWTYYEKFDYWAVFWGVFIMGSSGILLAFPHIAGQYLPGWSLNVATLVHGEEALLAALFLFTVHFFNNHFRPAKQSPPDIVMFTGGQTLEALQRDHPAQLERLLASGRLEQHLVDPPSPLATTAAQLLGLLLIFIGLALLFAIVGPYFWGR